MGRGIRAKKGMDDHCSICGSHQPYVRGMYVCRECYSIGQQLWPFQTISPEHVEKVRQYRWGTLDRD